MSNPMTREEHFFFQNTLVKKKEEKQRSVFHRRTVSILLPRFRSTCCSIFVVLLVFLAFQKGRASGSFLSVKPDLCEVPKLCKFWEEVKTSFFSSFGKILHIFYMYFDVDVILTHKRFSHFLTSSATFFSWNWRKIIYSQSGNNCQFQSLYS